MREQLIQDAAANRVQEIAGLLGLPWCHTRDDVATVEFSFQGGRVDVLATFDGRTRVLVVEVKQGSGDGSAVKQLAEYLTSTALAAALATALERPATQIERRGAVVAEGFAAGAQELAGAHKISLVQCSFDTSASPFALAPPIAGPAPVVLSRTRSSALLKVEDHETEIPPGLLALYRDLSWAFVGDDDPERRAWIYRSAKKAHVAVRYKGELVVCLWPATDTFLVGHAEADGRWTFVGDVRGRPADEIRRAVRARMDRTDVDLAEALHGFRWKPA